MNLFQLFLQVLSAFLGVVALAVLFHVPGKYLVFAGLTGAGGWFVELMTMHLTENTVAASLFAALFVALLSNIFARVCKTPVTLYLVPGIIPLVPGIGMYRFVFYLLQGDNVQASGYLSFTLQVAGMIALAIFSMDAAFKKVYRKRN